MNIHISEIPYLPLIAALIGKSGKVLNHTPEWSGAAQEALSYPLRDQRLVVNPMRPASTNFAAALALKELLVALEAGDPQQNNPDVNARMKMLAISLRAVVGRDCSTGGTINDLLVCLRAGTLARLDATPQIDVQIPPDTFCEAPEALALVLIQMLVNAHVHAQIDPAQTTVTINSARRFGVEWNGTPPHRPVTPPSRRDPQPSGWGLSFAQTIADALGGRVYPPRSVGPNRVRTACEIDVNQVILPLAKLARNQSIIDASPAWSEETNWHPGDVLSGEEWGQLINIARQKVGQIIYKEGRSVRYINDQIWLSIPPIDLPERIDSALHGIEHEASLWRSVTPVVAYRIRALSRIVGWLRSGEAPVTNRSHWLSRWDQSIRAFSNRSVEPPTISTPSALDPIVCAYLLTTYNGSMEIENNNVWLHRNPHLPPDIIWQSLCDAQDRIGFTNINDISNPSAV